MEPWHVQNKELAAQSTRAALVPRKVPADVSWIITVVNNGRIGQGRRNSSCEEGGQATRR